MMSYEEIFSVQPYGLDKGEKQALLLRIMRELTDHHRGHCSSYRAILNGLRVNSDAWTSLHDVPFLPTRLFKEFDLRSVESDAVFKTMTSSGTTGAQVSKIALDRENSAAQVKALSRIVCERIGTRRLPMLILDTNAVVKDRKMFSARGAGILGFSIFGRDRLYALDDKMNLDLEALSAFLKRHAGRPILVFGFTFMVWQHFYELLRGLSYRPDLSRGILMHGGGWKHLADRAISRDHFKAALRDVCGIEQVYDYYGMVEQTGTIHLECEHGHLHSSVYCDIVIRRHEDFGVAGIGERGIIQCLSVLPRSYPGHSLLTEDEGVLLGEDDCPCGRKGKYFAVLGRIKNAELRGCSDAYASAFA